MIKINLLNSVTDRAYSAQSVTEVVEKKVVNPHAQMKVVASAVAAMLALVLVFDYWWTTSKHAQAEAELAEQQRVAREMQAIMKEQKELEDQTKAIEARITAIKTLQSNQQGPVAVLSAVNERIPPIGNFRLNSIEQKAGELVVSGDSPNEAAVTQFGRSLEFSNGLFTNVSIELQRKTMPGIGSVPNSLAPETVDFKLTMRYTPPAQLASPQVARHAAPAPAATPATVPVSTTP